MRRHIVVAAMLAGAAFASVPSAAQKLEDLPMPEPTVPQNFTAQGEFVRIAYNREGFVTLGYRAAQQEAGNEWMVLQAGVSLLKPAPNYDLRREHFSIRTPDGRTIPMATQAEYGKANLRALEMRTKAIHDSINYFPGDVQRACLLEFFSAPSQQTLVRDVAEVSYRTACMGRLYFHVPGGIQPGQYWLDVQFASGPVQVPFRIFTEEQEKEFRDKWEDIKKQHEAAFGK